MKKYKLTLLTTTAFAVGTLLTMAPNSMAVDAGAKLNSADTNFIQNEAAGGAALAKIAELGAKKAERADVKAFAGMLVADHTKANAELRSLARSKGVELTTDVDSKHANTYEKLEGESAPNFDREFLSVVVSGHKKCISNFEDSAENAEDTELKAWAAKMLPALQAHLVKAEQLQKGSTAMTGATSRGTAATEPDNTARNKRDRDAGTLTPLDQGNSKTDTDTTAQIRRGIMDHETLSVNAKNVKIITNEGRVTLRGPVNSEEEKRAIGEIANRIATAKQTDNQLEVKVADAAN